MQEDLVKLFSDRFDELGRKLAGLRSQLQLKITEEETQIKEALEPSPAASSKTEPEEKGKKKVPRKAAPKPSGKTEAEKRIDGIKAEVEKVLERLGQIEVEG